MGVWKLKTVSIAKTALIFAVSLFLVTAGILIWNHSTLANETDNIEPDLPFEEPTNQQPNSEQDTPDVGSPLPKEPPPSEKPEMPNENEPSQVQTTPPPTLLGGPKVRIGDKDYIFNPLDVNSTRPDLFNQGQFSMFDILVYLNNQNEIELEYHFDETMNAYLIDAIDGETGWWYITFYDGGWAEQNVFRPDHYLWKPGTTLRFYRESQSKIKSIYSTWQQEIQRKERNNGKTIIPEVVIRGQTFTRSFEDVEVTPHNLRTDVFRENVITAIDVILSLGEKGKIDYELQWYDSIGTASVVRSYWVEAIENDVAAERCGWVYEAGSKQYRGFTGNHIHLPSDTRILNSPEYVEFFWICI